MLNFKKGYLSIKQQIENLFRKKGRKKRTEEKANFEFWVIKEEEELIIPSTSTSSRSSYSSCSSTEYEKKTTIHTKLNLKRKKMLLYIFLSF